MVVVVIGLALLFPLSGRLGDPYIVVLLLRFLGIRGGWGREGDSVGAGLGQWGLILV